MTGHCCRIKRAADVGRAQRFAGGRVDGSYWRNLAVRPRSSEGQASTHPGSSPVSREGPVRDQEEPFLE
jgi:hypothetical protein